MKIAIDVAGLAELDAALAEVGQVMATKIGERAFRESAMALQRAWVAGAPYDPTVRKKYWTLKGGDTQSAYYGHLRDNIRIRKVAPDNPNAIVFGVHTGKAFWAHFLEFGTVEMPARPWARPIVEGIKGQLIEIQVKILREGIEAAAKRRRPPTRGRFGAVMSNGRNG